MLSTETAVLGEFSILFTDNRDCQKFLPEDLFTSLVVS